jgi:hypothetical protein
LRVLAAAQEDFFVIPAKAGIQLFLFAHSNSWISASPERRTLA